MVCKTRTFFGRHKAPGRTAIQFEFHNIPQTILHRTLRKDLGLKPYKPQVTQQFKPADCKERHVFADWVLDAWKLSTFSTTKNQLYEVHFQVSIFVNNQYCCSWGSENPRVICWKASLSSTCEWLFDAVLGPAESLDLTFLKMRLAPSRDDKWFYMTGIECYWSRQRLLSTRRRYVAN